MDTDVQQIVVDPRRVIAVLVKATVAIVATGTAVTLVRLHLGWESAQSDFGARFELHRELSLPTWYSSALLGASAPVLALIALRTRTAGSRDWTRWAGLAFIVATFSLDEVASFHEYSSVILGIEVFGFRGAYNWVVFGLAFVAVLSVSYAPFIARLEPVVRKRLLLAAAVYFGGAVGVEMLNAYTASRVGDAGYQYALQTTLEESMEMAGALLLLHTVLWHLLRPGYRLVVRSAVSEVEPVESRLEP